MINALFKSTVHRLMSLRCRELGYLHRSVLKHLGEGGRGGEEGSDGQDGLLLLAVAVTILHSQLQNFFPSKCTSSTDLCS